MFSKRLLVRHIKQYFLSEQNLYPLCDVCSEVFQNASYKFISNKILIRHVQHSIISVSGSETFCNACSEGLRTHLNFY